MIKQFIEIVGINNIIIYFVVINVLGFFSMGIDKWKAKKGRWRIPENTLFMFTILGGGVGTILGMYLFRHKSKKKYFTLGMPAILILEIILIIYLYFR